MEKTTIGQRIRTLRNEHKMSLETLATRARISKAYLSQLENGGSERPSAEILYNIALTLGTSIAKLLGKEANPLVDSESGIIPSALEQAALKYEIPEEFVKRLAMTQMRNGEKTTAEQWLHLYMTVKGIDEKNSTTG